MYKFSVYDFSEKEINQIVGLVELWSIGSTLVIDRRKYTRQVIDYAIRWNLIIKGCEIVEWDYKTETRGMPYWAKANRYYPQMRLFNPVWDLPQEVLWRLTEPMTKAGRFLESGKTEQSSLKRMIAGLTKCETSSPSWQAGVISSFSMLVQSGKSP